MAVMLKDIANELGVSVTTVSRALAGYSDVAPATRDRVKDTAADLGYFPNIMVQRLRKQRTDTSGFIMPTFGPRFSDPFLVSSLPVSVQKPLSMSMICWFLRIRPIVKRSKKHTFMRQGVAGWTG